MIKIAMLGTAGVLLALFLKQQKPEYALYASFATAICILFFSVGRLKSVIDTVEEIRQSLGLEHGYMKILIKMIGITYVAEFASGICRDAGFSSVGNQIEMFGKFSILAVSVPILLQLIETMEGFLGS